MHAIEIRKMLTSLFAATVLATVASSANAADFALQATLFGQRGDQDATGRALWTLDTETGDEMLMIRVLNVSTSDRLEVLIDGQFVGTIQIVDEKGRLMVQSSSGEGDIPLVQPGSSLELYRTEDGVQLLFGVFGDR